ncbi:hypothetical protein HYALB_00006254 [Hymenoscyphus albidus]|uniref:F-box domain-containing protein n=1 Tax=Hymenoscyphus albidus TaxID=595503 RepID=A0A9N9Q8B0_9HELO|nr:hypothetical protein HYALB_00006254 [Hymenoscyphus albidus]
MAHKKKKPALPSPKNTKNIKQKTIAAQPKLDGLPNELLFQIFEHLNPVHATCAGLTCKTLWVIRNRPSRLSPRSYFSTQTTFLSTQTNSVSKNFGPATTIAIAAHLHRRDWVGINNPRVLMAILTTSYPQTHTMENSFCVLSSTIGWVKRIMSTIKTKGYLC